jgi:hypothetical protein
MTNLFAGTYTLTPMLAGYSFYPPTRTLTLPPNAGPQSFTILPEPVSATLTPTLAAYGGGFAFAGHAFDLDLTPGLRRAADGDDPLQRRGYGPGERRARAGADALGRRELGGGGRRLRRRAAGGRSSRQQLQRADLSPGPVCAVWADASALLAAASRGAGS